VAGGCVRERAVLAPVPVAGADQGNISLRVSDPFNTMHFGYRSVNGQVIEDSVRRFGMHGVLLTVTRNFGQQLTLRPKASDTEPQGPPTGGAPGA
jgi:hypothetical protein